MNQTSACGVKRTKKQGGEIPAVLLNHFTVYKSLLFGAALSGHPFQKLLHVPDLLICGGLAPFKKALPSW